MTNILNNKPTTFFTFVLLTTLTLLPAVSLQAKEPEKENWHIVNYWSQWCAPCRVEIPMFNALSEELSSSNISIVGVNFDEDPRQTTLQIAEDLGIIFPVLTIEETTKLSLRPPDVLPTTYILSGSNEVLAKLIGQQSRQNILEQLKTLGFSLSE